MMKRRKTKPSYYRLQIKKTKNSKWKTPSIREWGIKTPNLFKSKLSAYRRLFRLGQTSSGKKLFNARIKGFFKK